MHRKKSKPSYSNDVLSIHVDGIYRNKDQLEQNVHAGRFTGNTEMFSKTEEKQLSVTPRIIISN